MDAREGVVSVLGELLVAACPELLFSCDSLQGELAGEVASLFPLSAEIGLSAVAGGGKLSISSGTGILEVSLGSRAVCRVAVVLKLLVLLERVPDPLPS